VAVAERTRQVEAGQAPAHEESHMPPLLSSRSVPAQVVLAGVVPAAYGALCGWVLGVNEVLYIILSAPIAMAGQVGAGFEHRGGRSGALRGLVAGTLFGAFILITHELIGNEEKAELPHPKIILLGITALFGSGLGAIGGNWRGEAEEKGRFLDTSLVSPAEFVGMLSSGVLFASLFLPWFSTSDGNRNSIIGPTENPIIGPGDSANAWQTFEILDPLLVLACAAPFILTWIIAREHALTWRPGEVTMITGITAFVLILCNGIILGKPDPGIEISLSIGYFVALLGCTGMMVAGYLRQAVYTKARKPPGVL
jgi:hypothetical protein